MKTISLFVRYSGSNISAIGMVVVSVLLTLQFFSTFSFKASLSKRAVVAAFNSLPASLRKEENDVKYCWKGCLIKMSMWIFIMQSNSISVTSDCLNHFGLFELQDATLSDNWIWFYCIDSEKVSQILGHKERWQ